MIASETPFKEFEYDDNGELVCSKCGSRDISLIPKMYTTYYICNECGNEERI